MMEDTSPPEPTDQQPVYQCKCPRCGDWFSPYFAHWCSNSTNHRHPKVQDAFAQKKAAADNSYHIKTHNNNRSWFLVIK
jgi:hypothetical protein